MRNRRLSSISDLVSEEGGVNLTPLIDVVFVVLILFILIAPMVELDKVKLAQAASCEQTETEGVGKLLIHVHEDNTVSINKRPITTEHLPQILKALHAQSPSDAPQLFQDRKAFFGTYQMVKNAVEEAGFEELDVVLEPSK